MLSKGLAFEKGDPFSLVSVEKKDWLITLHIKSTQKRMLSDFEATKKCIDFTLEQRTSGRTD